MCGTSCYTYSYTVTVICIVVGVNYIHVGHGHGQDRNRPDYLQFKSTKCYIIRQNILLYILCPLTSREKESNINKNYIW